MSWKQRFPFLHMLYKTFRPIGDREKQRWIVYSAVRALEPEAYGFAISQHIDEKHEWDAVAALYVHLASLEQEGYLKFRWGDRPVGSQWRRRYYETTGKRLIAPETEEQGVASRVSHAAG
jgi:Transcriptional regulator PadR-like family